MIEGLNIVGLSIKLEWTSRIEAIKNLSDQFLLKSFQKTALRSNACDRVYDVIKSTPL
jgi:hypothetical protein